jgi:hypothetical protein
MGNKEWVESIWSSGREETKGDGVVFMQVGQWKVNMVGNKNLFSSEGKRG